MGLGVQKTNLKKISVTFGETDWMTKLQGG